MSLIMDEDGLSLHDFFDFAQLSAESPSPSTPADIQLKADSSPACIASADSTGSLNVGWLNDCSRSDPAVTQLDDLNPLAAFQDFSKFIPRYSKPATSCDYCRSKGLECFITYGCSSCSACNTLFRECSFVQTSTHQPHKGGYFDTLHIVAEDAAQNEGAVTGTKPLFSSGATLSDMRADLPERRSVGRYPKAAVRILKDWLNSHAEHPYPSDEEKQELRAQTGLKKSQISDWFANARRRGKVRPRSSLGYSCTTAPIAISAGDDPSYMTPLERWQNSPPEHEAASMSDIKRAVGTNDLSVEENVTSQSSYRAPQINRTSSTGSVRSGWRPGSTASIDTATSSGSLESSVWSHGSRNSYNSFTKKDRRRRRRTAPAVGSGDSSNVPRNFQCTFCTDTFRTKYDWSRHEKSLHLSSEKWICAPLGPIVTQVNDGHQECVYCLEKNPSRDHIENHNHSACEEKGHEARTFYRKDHLRQHLRLVHNVAMHKGMESWVSSPSVLKSRCGFCSHTFNTWQARVDHLAKHFREGVKMDQWKGDWGFEPHVTPMVTNCMPPFLIGSESKTLVPFSATNPASMREMEIVPSANYAYTSEALSSPLPGGFMSNLKEGSSNKNSSCWEILTIRLGEFVRQQKHMNVVITDDMLQKYARILLYGEEDNWNQTAADNTEWLTLFKQSHGLMPFSNSNTPGTGTGGISANTSDFGMPVTEAELANSMPLPRVFPMFDFLDSGGDETMVDLMDQHALPVSSAIDPNLIQFSDMDFQDFFLHPDNTSVTPAGENDDLGGSL